MGASRLTTRCLHTRYQLSTVLDVQVLARLAQNGSQRRVSNRLRSGSKRTKDGHGAGHIQGLWDSVVWLAEMKIYRTKILIRRRAAKGWEEEKPISSPDRRPPRQFRPSPRLSSALKGPCLNSRPYRTPTRVGYVT